MATKTFVPIKFTKEQTFQKAAITLLSGGEVPPLSQFKFNVFDVIRLQSADNRYMAIIEAESIAGAAQLPFAIKSMVNDMIYANSSVLDEQIASVLN